MKKIKNLQELVVFLNLYVTAIKVIDGLEPTMDGIEEVIRAVIPEFLEIGMQFNWEDSNILFHPPEKNDSIPLLGTIKWKTSTKIDEVIQFKFIK